MAVQAHPGNSQNPVAVEILRQAAASRRANKALARSLRTAVRELARLEAICEAHGIVLEVEPNHTDQES